MAAAELVQSGGARRVEVEAEEAVRVLLAAAVVRALRAGLGLDRVRAMFDDLVGEDGGHRG